MAKTTLGNAVNMVNEYIDEDLTPDDISKRVSTILAKGEFENFMMNMEAGLSFCDLSAAHQSPRYDASIG